MIQKNIFSTTVDLSMVFINIEWWVQCDITVLTNRQLIKQQILVGTMWYVPFTLTSFPFYAWLSGERNLVACSLCASIIYELTVKKTTFSRRHYHMPACGYSLSWQTVTYHNIWNVSLGCILPNYLPFLQKKNWKQLFFPFLKVYAKPSCLCNFWT